MESDLERPDQRALRELESVVRSLVEELGTLRRRAQGAEARLRELERGEQLPLQTEDPEARARVRSLEKENAELRLRLDGARTRTEALAERVRFLRQQAEAAQ